jgi:hypothetical protein
MSVKLRAHEIRAEMFDDEEAGNVSMDDIDELEIEEEVDSDDENVDEESILPCTSNTRSTKNHTGNIKISKSDLC